MTGKSSDNKAQLYEEIGRLSRQVTRLEKALAKSAGLETTFSERERWYTTLLGGVREGVFVVVNGSLTFVNEAFARLVGTRAEKLVGTPLKHLVSLEDIEALIGRLPKPEPEDDELGDHAVRLLHMDGKTTVTAAVKLWNFSCAEGAVAIGIANSPAAERRASSGRRGAKKKLRQSQELKAVGTMAGGVAQDMNNILAAIMSLASVLLTELDDPVRRADVEDILSAARRGRDLTRNLLGYSQKETFRREDVSLDELVSGVKELLSRTITKKIDWRMQIPEDLPAVRGDFGQLTHVLMNLCLNAADAMGDKGGVIAIDAETAEIAEGDHETWSGMTEGRYVRLQVLDNGCGMTHQVVGQAFDPFFTTKGDGGGSGLGLAVVYGTIKNHHGHVTIDSWPRKGTTVTVFLPASSAKQSEMRTSGAPPEARKIGGGRCVLLVEGEEMVRKAARRTLDSLGYRVIVAEDGPQALESLRKRSDEISVVLLDVTSDKLDGEELFYKLKDLDGRVSVVVASGVAQDAAVEELLRSGAAGFVQKPFDMQSLADAIAFAERVAGR
jgi:PAS domain S-box-containing protein